MLIQPLEACLQSAFGFDSFRPGQQEAIQSLLAGRHTLVVMPTGAGKSLIFQLAALQLDGLTLVISPLIALMKDQVDSLIRRGIPATCINSAMPASEQTERLDHLARGDYRIVYIAPERLRSAPFLQALRSRTVSLLAVDEAHCISEWGHDFRPDYLHIAQWRNAISPQPPLTAALTATATPQVQSDILRLLGLGDAARIVTGFNRPNLNLLVRYTSGIPAKLRALSKLLSPHGSGAVIIYTGTRRDAEEAAEFAREVVRIPAEFYHAGLPAEERTRIQNDFISGKLNVIAATNAFGMGIDRADVRQVIHHSLPGSLEAYYQEAGRAGRDGLPAQVTLLYDPQDRALQEFFIQQSELVGDDLRAIHNTIQDGSQVWTTLDSLSQVTGMHPVQLRVGLAALERAGALEHLGDEGLRMLFRKGVWNPKEIEGAAVYSKQHVRHRQAQLENIVAYAESNACRRRIILNYFGDTSPAEALECCDNCQNRQAGPGSRGNVAEMTHGERAALVILDCICRVHIKVGREKLAQILHGSKAQDILKFQHDKNVYYGRLEAVKQSDIEALIGQLIEMGHIKVIGGEYPVLSLTPRGENAIKQKESIALDLPKSLNAKEIKRAKAKLEAGGTVEYTAKLLADGLKPEQIAHERGLAVGTVYTHCAQLIANGSLELSQVVSREVQTQIESVIQKVGSVEALTPIKLLLPDSIDYGVIRCVIIARQTSEVSNIIPVGETPEVSAVESFLTRSHPRPLIGSWQIGWSLGFHSRFAGSDWVRSGVGDLAYRLKYQGDASALPALVEQALELIRQQPALAQADCLVPVPPSTPRPFDPVTAFCTTLAGKINLPLAPLVVKTRQTKPQKELKTLAQKRANVAGAFASKGDINGKRILVVDDLFDSGATLDEITRLLLKHGAAYVNVLTLTRTIHSDA